MSAVIAEYRQNADGLFAASRAVQGPLRDQYLILAAQWDRLARERVKLLAERKTTATG
jgi:hypothetical protein